MVTQRLSYALVRFGASRWPNSDEMLREWNAELHELAMNSRRGEMLRFAMSLAASRPANSAPLFDRNLMNRRFWTDAAILLLVPVVAIVFGMGLAAIAAAILVPEESRWLSNLVGEWSYLLSETARYIFMLAIAIGIALLVKRRAAGTTLNRPILATIALLVPILAALVLMVNWWGSMWRLDRAFPELPIWAAGMLLTLWAAGALAQRGRVAAAWITGLLGSFVTAQIAIMTVIPHLTEGVVDWGKSPLWLINYFNYRAGAGNFHHEISPTPELYLMVVPYALAFVITASRRVPASVSEAVPA